MVVALEVHLVRGMVRVANDPEVRELIVPLGRRFRRFACCRIQSGPRTAESHCFQVAQPRTNSPDIRGRPRFLWSRSRRLGRGHRLGSGRSRSRSPCISCRPGSRCGANSAAGGQYRRHHNDDAVHRGRGCLYPPRFRRHWKQWIYHGKSLFAWRGLPAPSQDSGSRVHLAR